MLRIIAGLSRSLPLVIALILLAIIIYSVVAWRRSPARAKEIMIKVFVILCSIIAVAFALVTLYAFIDKNMAVVELAASCSIIGIVGLVITLICRYFFRKHNQNYRWEITAKAKSTSNKPDTLDAITKILNYVNNNRPRR